MFCYDSQQVFSDSKKVTLRYANLLMNGEYKCEVSAEAPFFTTVHAESKMAIISKPTYTFTHYTLLRLNAVLRTNT